MQDTTQNAIHGGVSHACMNRLATVMVGGEGVRDQGLCNLSLHDIRALVDRPQDVPKGEARWCIPSTLQSRDKKRQMSEGQFVALWGDIDAPGIQTIESIAQAVAGIVCGCDFEVYATKSATEAKQKCRVLVPLSEATPYNQWLTAQAVLNAKIHAALGIEADTANCNANQIFFLPNRGDYYESRSERAGRDLSLASDWVQDLASHAEQQRREREAVKKAQEAAQKASQELQAAKTTQGFKSAIDAFNAAHYVGDILTQQGYDQNPVNPNLYRHPNSESGNYSASVQRDAKGVARVHSLSSADPLYTGGGGTGAHDAFSAFAVLAHNGNRDAALKDAGDNLLRIGGESWNKVRQREYTQNNALDRADAGFEPLEWVDPDTGEIAPKEHPLARVVPPTIDLKAPHWLLKNCIPECITIIAGSPGVGKTTALLPLAAGVAGLHEQGWQLAPKHWRHVVYITEDVLQAHRILHGLAVHLGITVSEIAERVHIVEAQRMDAAELVQVGPTYMERFSRTVEGVDIAPLVVLDTQAATIQLDDENNNAEASAAVDQIKNHFNGLPVWIVCHLAKSSADICDVDSLTARGASAWIGDTQGSAFLVKNKATGKRFLKLGKKRVEVRHDGLEIDSYTHEAVGLDPWGEPEPMSIRWGIANPADIASQPKLSKEEQERAESEALMLSIGALVDAQWQKGEPINKTGVRDQLGINKTKTGRLIEAMLNDGRLHEIKVPKDQRENNRKDKFLIWLDPNEREAWRQTGHLPTEKTKIPLSGEKPSLSVSACEQVVSHCEREAA